MTLFRPPSTQLRVTCEKGHQKQRNEGTVDRESLHVVFKGYVQAAEFCGRWEADKWQISGGQL